MSEQSDDEWVSDDDNAHSLHDDAVAGGGFVTLPSGASSVKKAADAKRKQKARQGESPAKTASRRAKESSARQLKRLADAAEGRTDDGDDAAAGGGYVTPSSGASPVKKAANAKRMQKARQGESPAKAQLRSTAKTAQKNQARKALLQSAIGATDLLAAKVFNEQDQKYLEANFDHDPAAAIAWMAASSQASFGYKNCPMDEQLEAVLGTDCSKVLPQGIRERILNDMKEAMDCRNIQSCAAYTS